MPEFVKLIDVYEGELPDKQEGIWNAVGNRDFQRSFQVVTVNPVEWFNKPTPTGQTPKEIYEDYAEPWQRKLVKQYRKSVDVLNATRYVVVEQTSENTDVIDGWHRMVAFALEGRTAARAIDLCLPQE